MPVARMTRIREVDENTYWVYGWDGTEWFIHAACPSLRQAQNAAARLRYRIIKQSMTPPPVTRVLPGSKYR
jgi:hypothetical protein